MYIPPPPLPHTTDHPNPYLVIIQVASIAASCCAALIWMMVVVVVVACCCRIQYRLALMLAMAFAPCVLTIASCAYGVSLLSTGANIPLAQVVVVTSCNLRWWSFFIHPLAQIVHFHTWWYHPLQRVLVVRFHPATGTKTALALGQLALCGRGQWWC